MDEKEGGKEIGKLEGQISGEGHGIISNSGGITSHVFLTLENNESVSAVRLLFLVGIEMRVVVCDHAYL